MTFVLKCANVFYNNAFEKLDILIDGGVVADISPLIYFSEAVDCSGNYIFPGFADVHVHLREPGFSYKETIKSGSMACARGGYTAVCTMPNLNPVPDCVDNLNAQLEIIRRDGCIEILPFASITKEPMSCWS